MNCFMNLNEFSKVNNVAKKIVTALMGNVNETTIQNLIPEIVILKGCGQNHPAHDLNVYQHTLKVINGLPESGILRLSALLHDIGKPQCKVIGDDGFEHFWGHQEISAQMAEEILSRLGFNEDIIILIRYLILQHDTKIQITEESNATIVAANIGLDFLIFANERIKELKNYTISDIGLSILELLFELQVSDLKAHSVNYASRKIPQLLAIIGNFKLG